MFSKKNTSIIFLFIRKYWNNLTGGARMSTVYSIVWPNFPRNFRLAPTPSPFPRHHFGRDEEAGDVYACYQIISERGKRKFEKKKKKKKKTSAIKSWL